MCRSISLGATAPDMPNLWLEVRSAPRLNLTLEQRHVIKEIIKDMKIEPAPPEVRAAVGDQIPQDINLQPMPSDVTQKVPQVKAHRFFVARQQIIIVDPKDNRVAEVIMLGAD
jgi:hypothetical protein